VPETAAFRSAREASRYTAVMFLGAHVPTAGGLANAPGHGAAVGAEAIQIFTRNQMQWRCKPLGEEEPRAFKEALARSGVRIVLAHGSYLVNLASPAADFREKSRACFQLEMERCHALGIPYLVFHPGAHMGQGEHEGLAAIARSLDHVLERTEGLAPMPLLEVTAGQGTCLGHRFSHLAASPPPRAMRPRWPRSIGSWASLD
jgi:deoxyribonuclease IV